MHVLYCVISLEQLCFSLPFEALFIKHLISTLFSNQSCCDFLKGMKSLNYGICGTQLSTPPNAGKQSEYTKLEKHTQNSCLKFTAVNIKCFV